MLRATLASLLLTVTGQAAAASGPGGMFINPVQVVLSPAVPTAALTVRNQGAEPARFQLTIFEWKQRADTGESLLTPSTDVLVSPPLLILAPGEERKIRLASTTTFGMLEKTFRLRIEQLQPPKNPDGGQQLRILTVFSLPIFLSPPKALPQRRLTASAQDGRWVVALNNTGNVHMQVTAMSVTGIGDSGETVFERQLDGSYVLPGMTRVFDIGAAPRACASLRTLRVTMKTPRGPASEDIPQPACTR